MAEPLTIALILEAKDNASEWIDRVRENVDRLAKAAEKASETVAGSADQMSTSLEKTDVASTSAAESMDREAIASQEAAAAAKDQAASADEATLATQKQTEATNNLGTKSEESAGKMDLLNKASKMVGLAMIGVAVVSAKLAIDFQNSTATLAGQAGISTQAANNIGNAFLQAGGKTTFTANQMMTAFAPVAGEFVNMYGHALDAAKSMKVMDAAMTLAEAGGGDLTTTTKALADAMMVFHLKVGQAGGAANVMFNTSRLLGVSVDSLGQSLTRLEPRIAGSGMSLKQTSAFMIELSKSAGGGRQAMRIAGSALQSLISPSTTAQKTLGELGISLDNGKGKFIGITAAISKIHDALMKLPGTTKDVVALQKMYRLQTEQTTLALEPQTKETKKQITALNSQITALGSSTKALSDSTVMQTLFGKSAGIMASTIAGGVPIFDKAAGAVSKQGEAAKAAALKQATFEGELKKLKSAAESIFIELGQKLLPVLTKLATKTVDIVNKIITWVQHNKGLTEVIVGVVIGVLALVKGIELVTAAIKIWAAAQAIIDGLLDANPLGAIILAVIALIAVLILVVTHWKDVKQWAVDAWHGITAVWDAAASWFDTHVIKPIAGFFKSLWDGLSSAASTTWHAITTVWDAVASWFNANVIQPVIGFFKVLWDGLSSGASTAWHGITSAWDAVASWFDTNIIKPIERFFDGLWGKITSGAKTAAGLLEAPFKAVGGVFHGIGHGIGSALGLIGLASGGLVSSPTLAMVGEAGPEMVIPLSKLPGGTGALSGGVSPLPSFGGGASAGGTVIQINLTMSGQVYGDLNHALNAMGRQLATVLVPGAGTRLSVR